MAFYIRPRISNNKPALVFSVQDHAHKHQCSAFPYTHASTPNTLRVLANLQPELDHAPQPPLRVARAPEQSPSSPTSQTLPNRCRKMIRICDIRRSNPQRRKEVNQLPTLNACERWRMRRTDALRHWRLRHLDPTKRREQRVHFVRRSWGRWTRNPALSLRRGHVGLHRRPCRAPPSLGL